MHSDPFWIWEATCISFGHAVPPYLLRDPKGYQISVGARTSENSETSLGYDAAPPFGPCDPEDPVVVEMSVEHKDLCGELGKPPLMIPCSDIYGFGPNYVILYG